MTTRGFIYTCGVAVLSASALCAGTSDVADAAMHQDKATLRTLLQKKADVNATQPDGATALMWAVRADDAAMVDMLIAAGADAKAVNRDGATALYLACQSGNNAIVAKLIQAGVDPNATVLNHGETPLMIAARSGKLAVVKTLLDHGADVNAKESLRNTTAVMWAAEQNHPDVVRLLAQRGADLNLQSNVTTPPQRRRPPVPVPQAAAQDGKAVAAAPGKAQAQAQQANADYNAPSGKVGGLTALLFAAREGAMDTIKALVEAKADVNLGSADGSSAALVAVQNGHYDVAKYLLDHGAKVNMVNDKGWNMLYLAVKNRDMETGTLPLPSTTGVFEFMQYLLEHGADVNARLKANTEVRNSFRATWLNEAGATPFLRASLCGDVDVMKLLLSHGADPKIATDDHTTPLMALAGVGFSDGFIHDHGDTDESVAAMKLLLDLGAPVNAANDRGLTALHGAAHKNFVPAIQLLVEHGANLAAEDKGSTSFGQTAKGLIPLDWAMGVPVGVQSAIYHSEAVDTITKLMAQKNIPVPAKFRTVGGNAKAATIKGIDGKAGASVDSNK